jgi:integrase
MTRRTDSIPKYRHYKPKDLAVVRIDGKDHYLGKFGTPESRERYHRLLAERAASGTGTPSPEPSPSDPASNRTVDEVILAFWNHARAHYRHPDGMPSEELANLKAALRPLRKLYALTRARDFGPLALRAVRDEMVRSGLARTSVNDRVNRIRRVFRWAASVELVPVAVVQALATVAGLQKGRTEAREPDPVIAVALDVVEMTLPLLSRPVAGLVRLQLLSGMRPGEACAMRGRDLSPGEEIWIYRPGSHKTAWRGKRREIPLGPRAVELIREFLRTDPDDFLFCPVDAVAEQAARRTARRKTRLSPSERSKLVDSPGSGHNRRYSRASYRNAVLRACDRAFPHPTIGRVKGRPLSDAESAELAAWRTSHRWHPNQLRHAAATDIRARYGLEAAQVVLGHSRADVTQVYAERDMKKATEVMREVG